MRKTITLTDQQDGWIKAQIKAGHCTNDSEVVRDLNRREQERAEQLEALRNAVIEGDLSGAPQPFEVQALKGKMLAQHG